MKGVPREALLVLNGNEHAQACICSVVCSRGQVLEPGAAPFDCNPCMQSGILACCGSRRCYRFVVTLVMNLVVRRVGPYRIPNTLLTRHGALLHEWGAQLSCATCLATNLTA